MAYKFNPFTSNFDDTLSTSEIQASGFPRVIKGTVATAAATVAKEVTISGYTLTAGDILCITYTLGTSAGSPTLNINGGGKISIYLGSTAASATTHSVGANGEIMYYYDGTNLQMFGSMRTSDSDTMQAVYHNVNKVAGVDITRYKIVMEGSDNKFYPLSVGDTTSLTKVQSAMTFKPLGLILWYGTTVTVAADAVFTYTFSEHTFSTATYTFNKASGYTNYAPIFLVGTIDANGFFVLDQTNTTSWFTQTLPSTEDGKVYIRIGLLYNTTGAIHLETNHPIYEYKNGRVREMANYVLPTASATVLGGVKVGDRLTITDGALSSDEITIVDEYADLAGLDSSITKAIVRYDTLVPRSYTTLDGNTLYEKLYINPLPPLYSEDYSDSYIMYSGQLLTLDTAATPADFAVGATITGASSGVSAVIGAKLTSLTYTIIKPTGNFTDGETLSDGTNSADQGTGYPTLGYNVVNGALEASEDAGFRLWTVQLTGVYLSADAMMAVQQNYIGDAFEISFDGKSYLRISGGWIDDLAYVDPDTDEVFAVTMYDKKPDTVSAFGPSYIVPASDDAANWHRIKYALQPTEFSINYSGVYQKIASTWTLIVKNDKLDNANIGVPVP